MTVAMKATRPMRPTMAKNEVNVIMLPPMFFPDFGGFNISEVVTHPTPR